MEINIDRLEDILYEMIRNPFLVSDEAHNEVKNIIKDIKKVFKDNIVQVFSEQHVISNYKFENHYKFENNYIIDEIKTNLLNHLKEYIHTSISKDSNYYNDGKVVKAQIMVIIPKNKIK